MRDRRWLVGMICAVWTLQLLWIASPIDPIVDVLPVLGWLDDLASLVVTLVFSAVAVVSLARAKRRELADPLAYEPWTRAQILAL